MAKPTTWKGVVKHFKRLSGPVQNYFEYFPDLAEEYLWEVSLAYVFSRLELAHNMTVYCGVVKLHRAERTVVRSAIQRQHLTRDGFKKMFESIHGVPIPAAISKKVEQAESVRDKIMHGKKATAKEQREALADAFDYANELDDFVSATSGFRPFADLRGFKGRAEPLDKSTTRWVLKGMGFAIQ